MPSDQTATKQPGPRRIEWLDVARGVALLAMAVYHITWDLEFFGYVLPGTTGFGGWKLFARCIASSFLFLVGVSLMLAHGRDIRWANFWRRFAMVAGAALAISIATYVAMPGAFIFFGILHQIALASLLGLAFLRLPAALTLLVAVAVVALPQVFRAEFFSHPALWWVGLAPTNPRSNDYVPLFPWFGAVLLGIAAARFAVDTGLTARLATLNPGRWSNPLQFLGRHSLAFYLIHQPVLIGCVWLFSQIFPAAQQTPEVGFRYACEASCQQSRDEAFCARYCACMLDELEANGDLPKVLSGDGSAELRERVTNLAGICTATTEENNLEDPAP
ncbi:heparan-alpha-glucosaminide N-acetyltransferase [Mesorhizobium sp. IMUNJ 23232]|uniref:heparan-alpha-glucosaminide N-acetyltransferase n=1 Tax=Mesorhizobium sp. IMUNJ 23232 TaxID=3376064 RepID=UPI0037A6D208